MTTYHQIDADLSGKQQAVVRQIARATHSLACPPEQLQDGRRTYFTSYAAHRFLDQFFEECSAWRAVDLDTLPHDVNVYHNPGREIYARVHRRTWAIFKDQPKN